MHDLKSIPDNTKWQLSAQCAARLPAMYDVVFRPVLQDKYDQLEREIWMDLAKFAFEIARSLQLPVRNAQEIAESLRTVTAILFGPDYKGEMIEVGDDGAVIMVKHCPFLKQNAVMGAVHNGTFNRCMAFTLSAQKNLNRKYGSRFVRAMCMGDRQCEIKVEAEKGEEQKRSDKENT
ncbi:MAG: hypothetical protein A4E35_01795 [Methanoregula sp. PtaU1.Bin051]|nr:MAG: hypothetical protein A4E35_01795 [Methanoregula sp. PtaU1.Bin051]